MKNPACSQNGVSELIGALLMIIVLVLAISIFGLYLVSQPHPAKIPSLQATVWNDTQRIYISHDGGDPLNYNEMRIYVDGIDRTSGFSVENAEGQPWTTWSIGNILMYVTGASKVSTVQIIYTGTGSSAMTLATLYVGPVGGGGGVAPPPVMASFTGTPLSGPAPLSVQFSDASTGPVVSWLWAFGDGGTSTEKNPVHIYSIPNRYTVSLIASNGSGSSTAIRTNYIYVPVCFADNFDDNSKGSAWSFISGTWEESGGVMRQTSTAAGDPKKAIISNTGLDFTSDHTITAKVRVDSWANGDMARAGVSLFTNTADGNGYNIVFHNNQNTVQFLDDKVTWGPTYSYSFTTGTWYWFKLNMTSGTMYARIWQDGSAEPSTWPYVWARSGRTGFPALNGGSSTGGADWSTASFDDVLVCAN